jgi:isopenicillin N synthase-like dioxygenase
VTSLPVIDVAPFVSSCGDQVRAVAPSTALRASPSATLRAGQIRDACRRAGFFYIVGHGVDEALQARLELLSRRFFAEPLEKKLAIRMELGGQAWRGYFPVRGELTRGKPDLKEGLYFGAELPDDHPRVAAGTPLHGRNLFPDIPGFRETVLDYISTMTRLGHALMQGFGLSLGLDASYFDERYTRDPLVLFRIFNYPASEPAAEEPEWGVGEHTDYGLLTILKQDDVGGLQVKGPSGWIDAPPIPGAFVCNIGDMLDRMTGGFYRSTPHRVLNPSGRARLSFPFFFDPGFDAEVQPIRPGAVVADDKAERWDGASVHEFSGTYGDYILAKVSKVFPELRRKVT